MALNNLTPEQDIATREFYDIVAAAPSYLQDSPAHRRQLIAILLEALNYNQLPNGAFVSKDTNVQVAFGSKDYSQYPDEWDADKERAVASINSKDTAKASTSSKTKNTKVREAVLSKDV